MHLKEMLRKNDYTTHKFITKIEIIPAFNKYWLALL